MTDINMIGARPDGRGLEEFRPIFVDTRVLNQAKGSAYIELENTKVMAGVFGPRQSERKYGFQESGRLHCDVKFTAFAAGSMSKQEQMAAERALSQAVCQALSPAVDLMKFPKAVMDISIMVLEKGGGEVGAAITAASAALADAGVEMRDVTPGCHVVRAGGQVLLDPGSEEGCKADASLLLAAMPTAHAVTLVAAEGAWSGAELVAAQQLAMGGCAQLREAVREALIEAAAAR